MATTKSKIKIRSKVKAPPTKVFVDRKKEQSKTRCRGKMPAASFLLVEELLIATNHKYKIYVSERTTRTAIINL